MIPQTIIISSSIISIIIKAFCQFKGEKRGKATHFYIQYSNLLLQYINTMRLKVWSRGPVEKLGFMCKCYRTCLLYPLGDVRLPKFKMHMCLCLSVSVYLFWVVLLSLQGQYVCLKVVLVYLEIDLFFLWVSFGRGWHKPVIDLLCTKIRFELD